MNIVNDFKDYLFSQNKPAGAITIKNYMADVRKFISWFETTYQIPFTPDNFTIEIINSYQKGIQTASEALISINTMKRYLSSLRKLANFMVEKQLISKNPFISYENKQNYSDPFYLRAFKNFLSSDRASKLTIKNYLNDIKQFLEWLEAVTKNQSEAKASSLLDIIDNHVVEEYKMRLLNEAKLSPVSINRKLSSLRRYLRWLEERKVITFKQTVNTAPSTSPEPEKLSQFDKAPVEDKELPLIALQKVNLDKTPVRLNPYSSFPPFRMGQKSIKIINLGLDLLIFNPIVATTESIQYLLWKSGKKVIFAPVIDILENSSALSKSVIIKTIIPKQLNFIPPRTANTAAVMAKVAQYKLTMHPTSVRNFTKALYAPLEMSTEQMHWMQKLWLNMRHKRPLWYKKYHSYPVVGYIHFAVLIIAMTFAGSAVYQTWSNGNGRQYQAVLAAQETSPPRTLTFQGKLLDKTNTPITVETPLRFALYNSPTATGSAKLWEEKQDINPDQNGNFTATLGAKSRLDQQIFKDNPDLYVGIAIGDNPELLPRQQIPTANYAAESQSVEGLKPITDFPDRAQNVLLALDSSGNLTIGGTASHTIQATGGQLNISGQALLLTTNAGSNGNVKIAPDGSGIIDMRGPIQNTSNSIDQNGVIGAVDVQDILSVSTTSSSQSALIVNQNGAGDIISGRSNGVDKFRLDNGGNAFIGGDLILKGDTIDSTSTAFDIGGSSVKHLTIGSNATVLSLGGSTGITSVRNSLSVEGTTSLKGPVSTFGMLSANAGLTIPNGQTLAFANFTPGSILFIGANSQVAQDAAKYSWNDSQNTLNVLGSLCVNSVAGGTCDNTAGTITAKTLNTTGTADLAENYISSENLEPGDVVTTEEGSNTMAVIKSTTPYQNNLIGIVSTNPGITLDSDATPDYEHPNVYPLALQGRVPIKVSSINGPIQTGDELTSSGIPGVAMLASASGQTIGKALEPYSNANPNAVGKIMAFVNLTYYSAPATITGSGDVTITSKPESQVMPNPQIAKDVSASGSASETSIASKSGDLNLDDQMASTSAPIYNSIASISATTASASAHSQESTPTPTVPDVLQTNAELPSNFSSLSQSTTGQLTYVPNFKSDYATFNNGLISLGPASLTDVAVSGIVVINNNLKITSDSLDTIASDLNIQPLRQGNILFQGGLVAIDTQGNLKVNGNATFAQDVTVNGQLATGVIAPIPNQDLTVNLKNKANQDGSNMVINNANGNHIVQINQAGDIIASGQAQFNSIASQGFTIIRGAEADASNTITVADGSGGKGLIAANQTERTIITPYVTTHSLIYVTATSNAGSDLPYVARQTPEDPQGGTKGAFTVEIPTPLNRDISFNWWIVN